MIPYRNIEEVERVKSPLAPETADALALWHAMYRDCPPWKRGDTVKTLNLPALICSELARQVLLEMKLSVSPGKGSDGARAAYLAAELEKLRAALRPKLEQGFAAGGMLVKPWPDLSDGHIYFDWAMDWSLWPLAFDGAGALSDVVIPDVYRQGGTVWTRLERHRVTGRDVEITQRAFRSAREDALGTEVPLNAVERWAGLPARAVVERAGGPLFGWFRVASANSAAPESPLGASAFARAAEVIREVDKQYSRLLWEFEGGELAVDVDPTALRQRKDGEGRELPRLNERLFRAVDTGADDTYRVFSPTIRDVSLINGLNQLLMRVEDLCGLARGTLAQTDAVARTATELKILRQRGYATISDNQMALERCLRDVVRAMDVYATAYGLAPEGSWELTIEWGDSVVTDIGAQLRERLLLAEAGVISKAELREWYFGESPEQARTALAAARAEAGGAAG